MPDQADARPELGPMLKEARISREWTVEHVQVALGFFIGRDGKAKVLNRTQVNRIEAGDRALSAEEAWRFVEIYPELDALELLRAANAIDEDASPEFRSMIEAEAARRRDAFRQGGNRRRSERAMKVVTHAADIVAATVLRGPHVQSGDCAEALRAA
jgi:transcriptional regulator with XRE-family HTH domain